MSNNSTRAKVRMTIEIDDLGNWSEDTSLKQIQQQAREAAISRITHALSGKATLVKGSVTCQVIVTEDGHKHD